MCSQDSSNFLASTNSSLQMSTKRGALNTSLLLLQKQKNVQGLSLRLFASKTCQGLLLVKVFSMLLNKEETQC